MIEPSAERLLLLERFIALRSCLSRRLGLRRSPELLAGLGGVTVHQLEALRLLEERKTMTMSELAREMEITESAATALADRLFRLSLVERQADPADRRVVRLEPSERAKALTEQFERHHLAILEEALAVLDDERLASLVEMFEAIAAGPKGTPAGSGADVTPTPEEEDN